MEKQEVRVQVPLSVTPFEIVYSQEPSKLVDYIPGTARLEVVKQEIVARNHVLKEVRDCIFQAQAQMKKLYDSKHRER